MVNYGTISHVGVGIIIFGMHCAHCIATIIHLQRSKTFFNPACFKHCIYLDNFIVCVKDSHDITTLTGTNST